MGMLAVETPLIEPAMNLPIYCSGLAEVAVVGGDLHSTWFVELRGPCGIERVINLRTILPAIALQLTREKVDQAIIAARRLLNS